MDVEISCYVVLHSTSVFGLAHAYRTSVLLQCLVCTGCHFMLLIIREVSVYVCGCRYSFNLRRVSRGFPKLNVSKVQSFEHFTLMKRGHSRGH